MFRSMKATPTALFIPFVSPKPFLMLHAFKEFKTGSGIPAWNWNWCVSRLKSPRRSIANYANREQNNEIGQGSGSSTMSSPTWAAR
jgi:hypothetical protein